RPSREAVAVASQEADVGAAEPATVEAGGEAVEVAVGEGVRGGARRGDAARQGPLRGTLFAAVLHLRVAGAPQAAPLPGRRGRRRQSAVGVRSVPSVDSRPPDTLVRARRAREAERVSDGRDGRAVGARTR